MKHTIKQNHSHFCSGCLLVGLSGCGVVNSGTTEYNELVALVQGVQAAAANFQLVTDTQYAKIQAKNADHQRLLRCSQHQRRGVDGQLPFAGRCADQSA